MEQVILLKQAIENIEFFGIKENEFTTLLNCKPIFTIHDIKNITIRSEILTKSEF